MMDGRHFDGHIVEAYISDGKEKFRKSTDKKNAWEDDEEDEEDKKRLDKFSQWIETDEGNGNGDGVASSSRAQGEVSGA